MSGLVLDLQHEVLKADCDILNALRKAHLIAVKLKLHEFDKWIHAELNGYEENQDLIPEYRRVRFFFFRTSSEAIREARIYTRHPKPFSGTSLR